MSVASVPPSPPRRRRFLLLFGCLLVIGAGNSMLLAVAPPLVRQLGLSDASVGWIFSLSALLWVLTSPGWGRFSDRAGRKPVAAFGLGAYAVSMASFAGVVLLGLGGVLSGAWLFLGLMFSRAIFGAFGSATSPASQAYVADRTSRFERTEHLAALGAAFSVGQAFGPAMCAALAAWFGLVFPIALTAVLAAVASWVIWRFLPENTPPQPDSKRGNWRDSVALVRDKRLSAFLIYGFGMSVVAGVIAQTFGLFVMDRLNASGERAAEYTAAGFMVAALSVLATQMGILPRLKLEPRALMVMGSGLLLLGVLLQIMAPSLGALLVSQAVQGVGGGLARPGFAGGASLAVRPDEQGAAAGLMTAINGSGFIFSPLLGGVAYQYIGMTAPLFIAAATLAGMTLFAYRSRRLRSSILAEAPPSDPTPPS